MYDKGDVSRQSAFEGGKLTRIDARSSGNHDDVAVSWRHHKLLDDDGPLQLNHGVVTVLHQESVERVKTISTTTRTIHVSLHAREPKSSKVSLGPRQFPRD